MSSDDMDVDDETNSTKRCCRQVPQNEPVRNIATWETLPYPATVGVFSYLCDKDRVAMAQVCRAWNNCFKNPSLWRTRKFTMKGNSDNQNICFTSIFGKHLQNVDLKIWYGLYINLDNIAKSVEDVTENLKNARLHHLKLRFLSYEQYKKFPELLNTIYNRIIKMFQTQTELKNVTLASCRFSQSIGTELLKTLATSTGDVLVYLDIIKYIDKILNINDLETLKETLTTFSNLTNISINYSYISDEVLRHWAVSLRHKLQSMRIMVSNREPHYHIIQRGTWRQLSSSCPNLTVSIAINSLPQASEIISILQPTLPLTTLILNSVMEASQLAATLKHLAGCLHHRLEYLIIECEEMHDVVDEGLIDVLEQCRRLHTFRFTGNFSIMVPNKIFDLLKDSQSVLCSCDVGYDLPGQDVAKEISLIGSILPFPDDTEIYDDDDDDDIIDDWTMDFID